jgi:hypothetical protein
MSVFDRSAFFFVITVIFRGINKFWTSSNFDKHPMKPEYPKMNNLMTFKLFNIGEILLAFFLFSILWNYKVENLQRSEGWFFK